MKDKYLLWFFWGLLGFSIILLINQTPFPYLKARAFGGLNVKETKKLTDETYKGYVFLSEKELKFCYFEKEIFWRNQVNVSRKRDNLITVDYLKKYDDSYGIIYGCCNDMAVKVVELITDEGTCISILFEEESIFAHFVSWNEYVEIKCFDTNKNLLYYTVIK